MALGGDGAGGGSSAIEAGRAFVRLFTDRTELEQGLRAAQRNLASFGKATAKAGAVALAGAAAGGKVAFEAIDTLKDMAYVGNVAQALGTPVEKLSGLFGIMKAAGSPLKESIESISQFGTAVNKAVEGKGEEAGRLFEILGRSADDFKRMDPAEGIYEMFRALEQVQDPLDKTRALSIAFGTDGMKLLLPMLNKSSDELQRMARLFAVTPDDAKRAREATEAYGRATALLGRAWEQVAVALAPTLGQVAGWVSDAAVPLAEFIKQNRVLVTAAAVGAAGLGVLGAGLIGLGTLAGAASLAIGGIGAVVGAVLSPLGLAAVAVAGLGMVLFTQTEIFDGFLSAAIDTFQGVKDALTANDLELAGRVAMAGLNLAWQEGLLQLQKLWTDFKSFFVDGWHDAVTLIAVGFVDLVSSFKSQIGEVVVVLRRLYDMIPTIAGVKIGDVFGIGDDVLGAAEGVLKTDPDALKKLLLDDARREQGDRDRSRGADLTAQRDAVAAARAELDRLTEEARRKAAAIRPGAKEELPNRLGPPLASLAGVIGTVLGGANAFQVFGGGTAGIPQRALSVAEKTLDETVRGNAIQERILEVLDQRDAEFGRFG